MRMCVNRKALILILAYHFAENHSFFSLKVWFMPKDNDKDKLFKTTGGAL